MKWFASRFGPLLLLLVLSTPAWSADEIYKGLGEKSGIDRMVSTLMALIKGDARMGESVQDSNHDMDHFEKMLSEQFCEISGGPCKYSGKDMAIIHDGLEITAPQFYALVENVQTAMERHGIVPATQNRFLALLAPMYRAVVTR